MCFGFCSTQSKFKLPATIKHKSATDADSPFEGPSQGAHERTCLPVTWTLGQDFWPLSVFKKPTIVQWVGVQLTEFSDKWMGALHRLGTWDLPCFKMGLSAGFTFGNHLEYWFRVIACVFWTQWWNGRIMCRMNACVDACPFCVAYLHVGWRHGLIANPTYHSLIVTLSFKVSQGVLVSLCRCTSPGRFKAFLNQLTQIVDSTATFAGELYLLRFICVMCCSAFCLLFRFWSVFHVGSGASTACKM